MINARRRPSIEASGYAYTIRKYATQLGRIIPYLKSPARGIQVAGIGWMSYTKP